MGRLQDRGGGDRGGRRDAGVAGRVSESKAGGVLSAGVHPPTLLFFQSP